jgi:hypothetical protein
MVSAISSAVCVSERLPSGESPWPGKSINVLVNGNFSTNWDQLREVWVKP